MTYIEACRIWLDRNNAYVENNDHDQSDIPIVDPGKGGRFFVGGEFTLEEMEALLTIGKYQMLMAKAIK